MIRSNVDLPAPFEPITPILAPGYIEMLMFSSTCRSGGWKRDKPRMVKMNCGAMDQGIRADEAGPWSETGRARPEGAKAYVRAKPGPGRRPGGPGPREPRHTCGRSRALVGDREGPARGGQRPDRRRRREPEHRDEHDRDARGAARLRQAASSRRAHHHTRRRHTAGEIGRATC